LQNPPKNSRRTKPAPATAGSRKPWPSAFQPGDYVREIEHPARWGRLVAPGTEPLQWIVQYSTGARMKARNRELELFSPSESERATIEKATAFFEKAMGGNGSTG
jgi:hypothetical protein